MYKQKLILSSKQVNLLAFWIVAFLCILNLNAPMKVLLNIPRPMSVIILLCCGIGILTNRYKITRVTGKAGMWYLTAMIVFLLVAGLSSDFSLEVLKDTSSYVIGFLLIFYSAISGFYIGRDNEQNNFIRNLFFVFLVSTCSVFFSETLLGWGLIEYSSDFRRSGFFPEPNEAAQVGCMTQVIGFALLRRPRRRFPIFIVIGIILCYLSILYTYSRAAILTSILITFIQLFFLRESRFFRGISVLISVVLLAGIFWLFSRGIKQLDLSGQAAQRLTDTRALVMEQQVDVNTTGGRLYLFKHGWRLTWESPIIGNGLNSLKRMRDVNLGCHNSILLIFGEAGIIVGLFFLAVMAYWVRVSFRVRDPVVKSLILNYLIVLILSMMVLHTVFQRRFHNILTGLCFGMAAGLAYRESKLKEAKRVQAEEGNLDLNNQPDNPLPPTYTLPPKHGVLQ